MYREREMYTHTNIYIYIYIHLIERERAKQRCVRCLVRSSHSSGNAGGAGLSERQGGSGRGAPVEPGGCGPVGEA